MAPNAWTVYRRLLRYVWPHRWMLAASTLAAGCAAGAAAFYAYLIGPLLEAVLTGGQAHLGDLRLGPDDLRFRLPAAVVLLGAAKATAQFVHGGITHKVGQRVMTALRIDLYAHLLKLPPRFFETRHSGELLSRFTQDVDRVEFAVAQALTSYVKDTLQIIALLGVCLAIDGRLFLLAFVVLPAAAFPVARFARSVKKVATRTQASLGQLSELCAEVIQNLPIVGAFRGETRLLARFDDEQARYAAAIRRSLFIRGAFTPTVEVLGIVGVAVAIGYGAAAVQTEPALAGKLVSFLAASLLMYQPLKALSGTFGLVMQGVGAAERLFEIADAPAPKDEGSTAPPLRTRLELADVRLSYDGQREALRGLSLEVPSGKRVALVGASGAGKSSVFSALLGFVMPTAGRILWDGESLGTLRLSSVRAQMAWVQQEPVLFSGSVRQNLLVGRPDATDAEVWMALRQAHADKFVRELPEGLDEQVGERGARLSGGQKQRIAIARAFLAQPSVLLLDEPTSSLDAESEREVQAGLKELERGRTVLVIAHRLATVRDADLIYVLDDGAVVEQGRHAELVARGGRYARLLNQGDLAAA